MATWLKIDGLKGPKGDPGADAPLSTLTDAVSAATGSEISLIYSTSGGTPLTDAVSSATGSEVSMVAVA